MIAVNLTSQMLLTRTLIPILKTKGKGDLIFLGSEAALKGSRKGTVYCASKFAIRGFTQALREECARNKVRVTLINPGMVKTAFFEPLDFEPGDADGQAIKPEDIAQIVQFVLNTSAAIVFDEINLSPLNKVINFNKK
jgi:NADP-dependent 3-hydroxy acid dehydrogenase YdfG